MKLDLKQIAECIGAEVVVPLSVDPRPVVESVYALGYSIDTRTILPGELFFAVIGERLDGHDFVAAALAAGAVAAVVDRKHLVRFPAAGPLLVVEDTLAALQALATFVRKLWGGRLIAITGSAGKTSTKEITASILATSFRVLKSEGNLNNHFGLPLQLLKLDYGYELAVMELGMSHSGEIAALAKIAKPDIGVVTCVAPVHLGFFSSVAEIARAKYELVQALPPNGIAVLNADDDYVSQFGRNFSGKVVTFAISHPADVRAQAIRPQGGRGSEFEVVTGDSSTPALLPLIGEHNIYNALAAIAVAVECGMSPASAAAALSFATPADKRGQVLQLGGATVINDCYNSNPKALESMVDALAAMELPDESSGHHRRIVVAGEMLELGPASEELHRGAGRYMAEHKVDFLLGVRGAAQYMVESAKAAGLEAQHVETAAEAGGWLLEHVRPGDIVLLKASRGVRLEHALEHWNSRVLEHIGTPAAGPDRGSTRH